MNSPINQSKILHHMDRIVNDHRPITADIFLDNYCNNNCGYCVFKRWEFDEDAESMSYEDFVRYADRLKKLGVLGFILSGGGEPTIAKDFDKIAAYLDDNDFKWGINTNFNRYVRCNPDYLKVSLDAWDEDSYEKVRGVRAYKQVLENISRFASRKSAKTKLGIQLIATNPEDVNKFYEANKNLPVDYMVIRPVESTDGYYYKTDESKADVTAILNVIKCLQQEDPRVVMNFKWEMLGRKFRKCEGQWSQMAVNWLGEVMYCCHKPYEIIGHVMDDDILAKKMLATTDMAMCDIPCRLTSVNSILETVNSEQTNVEFI